MLFLIARCALQPSIICYNLQTMTQKPHQFDFEETLKELEGIVREFETNRDLPLEDALRKLERGLELVKASKERLSIVENKIEELKLDFGSVFDER